MVNLWQKSHCKQAQIRLLRLILRFTFLLHRTLLSYTHSLCRWILFSPFSSVSYHVFFLLLFICLHFAHFTTLVKLKFIYNIVITIIVVTTIMIFYWCQSLHGNLLQDYFSCKSFFCVFACLYCVRYFFFSLSSAQFRSCISFFYGSFQHYYLSHSFIIHKYKKTAWNQHNYFERDVDVSCCWFKQQFVFVWNDTEAIKEMCISSNHSIGVLVQVVTRKLFSFLFISSMSMIIRIHWPVYSHMCYYIVFEMNAS